MPFIHYTNLINVSDKIEQNSTVACSYVVVDIKEPLMLTS